MQLQKLLSQARHLNTPASSLLKSASRAFAVELSSGSQELEITKDGERVPLYFDNQATTPVDPRYVNIPSAFSLKVANLA